MTQSPYQTNDPEALRRLASAADVYLQGQLSAAVAADQRALVFAGFLAAAVAAIGGAAAAVLTGNTVDHFLGKLALLTGLGLIVSMIGAVIAARPAHWYFPGSHPKDWKNDFKKNKPEIERLQELLADYDDRISKNHATMKTNGNWITASASLAVATLLISGLTLTIHVWCA